MKTVAGILAVLFLAGATAFALAYALPYNVAADVPHWGVTTRALAAIRDHSIATRAEGVAVPDLADPALIALGAEHYGAMCTGCHLAPGVNNTELSQGLNPTPPDLSQRRNRHPAETFWIIKHGIRMTGMPAWGLTHDDESIWGLVAFLQQLPTLDAAGYAAATGGAPEAGGSHGGHDHGQGAAAADGDGLAEGTGATMDPATVAGHAHEHSGNEGHDH